MLKYVSNKGGCEPVDFETAILDGFASDGGLYVPQQLPHIPKEKLRQWSALSYIDLAFEILSLFIDRSIISGAELKQLLHDAYDPFEKKEVIPLHKLQSRKDIYIMELFYGPTLSFKDIGLSFLVNLVDFFLKRQNERRSIIVATTGDTGPAAAYLAAGKSTLDTWVLYPKGLITEEQERQMTTITASNVHPVGVYNCPDGGDDLDLVVSKLFENKRFKEKLKLSSVNSINWGRIMMQTVHYFYGYFRVITDTDETINIGVPSGAFGNLCAGTIAREMGLPVDTFVCANNENACLHRIFSQGVFSKQDIIETVSSAIDILIPYNFWRYLYFSTGQNPEKISKWMSEFASVGYLSFDDETFSHVKKGILSHSVSDENTLSLIKETYEQEGYLLDPHGAVALAAAGYLKENLKDKKLICLATAHPAKFSKAIQRALGDNINLPPEAFHNSIEAARKRCQKLRLCEYLHLEEALMHAMESQWDIARNAN